VTTDAAKLSGFIIVNKPSRVTSFSMVSLIRRLTGVRRVGHAGTLDPLASGVLPVAVGHATRLIEYLDDVGKTYVARISFGMATDTYDADGEPTRVMDASRLTAEAVESELSGFVGDIEQTPPLYSALKIAGKPLYRYAREGTVVAVAARVVSVESIELRSFGEGVAEIEVSCGKGTYIRSLAHDLGARLGCGGHLSGLVRSSTGGFGIEEAHAPEELIAAAAEGRLDDLVLAPDRAVERRPAVILEHEHAADVRSGRELRVYSRGEAQVCRAYSVGGAFLGLLKRRSGALWHPEKVWPDA
jgi:tRNA pseudouridine55 synthase